ncbi:hypothetical protein [Streptomyces prunicolor]
MSTADHILNQIDACLGDHEISDDAMRCAPDLPPLEKRYVQMTLGVGPREILIRRLVEQHGLTRLTARHAVLAVERGGDSERANLVRAEAQAVAAEMGQRIRIAFQPMAQAAIAALKQISESLKQLQQAGICDDHGKPVPRRDRPAWQSPYGPVRRRQ